MGWISNIIACLVGSCLGKSLLGSWCPHIADMVIFQSIIGAIILVIVTLAVFEIWKKRHKLKRNIKKKEQQLNSVFFLLIIIKLVK